MLTMRDHANGIEATVDAVGKESDQFIVRLRDTDANEQVGAKKFHCKHKAQQYAFDCIQL